MIGLAFAYLRAHPLTTALNILLLGIAVTMLVLLLQFGRQVGDRLEQDAAGIDLVVGAKGSPLQLILSSVFHVDQPTGNIPLSSQQLLKRDPAVERVIPLALGDNFRGYRIVGTDEGLLGLYGGSIEMGSLFDAPLEAVLGASVAAEMKATLGQKFLGSHGLSGDAENGGSDHDHAAFETVGILAPTGTVLDRLILTSVESVWDVHGIAHDHGSQEHADDDGHAHEGDAHDSADGHAHDDEHADDHGEEEIAAVGLPGTNPLQARSAGPQRELTALLVQYRNASAAIRVPAMINRQTEMQAAVPAIETARLLSLFGASLDGARLFAWLLAATGGLAIFVALLNVARAREGDLALLRVMGAGKMRIFGTILLEGVLTAAAGALLGIAAAHLLIGLAANAFATIGDLGIEPFAFDPLEGVIFFAVLGIGAVAAVIPAARIFSIDLARTLARAT
ncbi:ABC transporter permease [Pacificimonas sp. WHA3]|uniref:ABC transporter permease n=1 Tax=Pacificimonas pallii TaxID=2827236 RepID=A0ABS6SIA5_9SPHN|nr:ABC transporter permease [Pacificimonas pallii]MBV7257597.1 ABC transporter permease [Pacificimonas pallii]